MSINTKQKENKMEKELVKKFYDVVAEMKSEIEKMVRFCGGYAIVDQECCDAECAPGYGYVFGVFILGNECYIIYNDDADVRDLLDDDGNVDFEPDDYDRGFLENVSIDWIVSLYEAVVEFTKEYEMVRVIG